MEGRADPVVGAARLIEAASRLGLEGGGMARATVGRLEISPNSINSIASEVAAHAEFRAPTDAEVAALSERLAGEARAVALELGLSASVETTFQLPATAFDPEAVETVRRAARALGLGCKDMLSGAGHDAANLSKLAPAAMIFIPCRGGVSHAPGESITPAWAEAGANALLLSVLEKAMEQEGF
jgi:N-carbamoyl-L-amino-acid hydrolase